VVPLIERVRTLSTDFWLAVVAAIVSVFLIVQFVSCALARKVGEELIQASLSRPASTGRMDVKGLDHYSPILEKGHLGKKKPPPGPPQLFGILGECALMGSSPNDVKAYTVGADLPGGAKLVEIALDSVVLEKDGNKQTIVLFPPLGAKGGAPPPGRGRPQGPPREPTESEGPGETRPDEPEGREFERPDMPAEPPSSGEEVKRRIEKARMKAREMGRRASERRNE